MYKPEQVDQLIAAMRETGTTRLDMSRGERRLVLELGEIADGPALAMPAQRQTHPVSSPGLGVFVPRGGDDGLPLLAPGTAVIADEVLGYIAQGSLHQILTAPVAGTLTGPLPDTGKLFGHGDCVLTLEVAQ
jgi:hypothetical protein